MATDYRDDTLSADRYIVQTEETAPVSTTTARPYTGTNVQHPRFPRFRKDMTPAQKRAHTKAGKPTQRTAAPAPVARASKPVAVAARKPGSQSEIVRLFAKPVAGLSKKSALLIASLLATPANVSEAQWLVLDAVAQGPAAFDLLTLRAALGVAAPVKVARKAA